MAALAGALVLFALVGSASADISVSIQNLCDTTIQLYDNSATTPLAAGATTSRTLTNGYVGMFRHTSSEQATLAEISVDAGTGRPWYDISIIPPGPGNCGSLAACKAATGKVGFNVAMQITPLTNVGTDTCATVTCRADGCADAYSYPADDTKTHNCPSGTNFQVTFCPGGTGGATPAPTTAAPTAAPTTAAPTPTPTPTPTPSPTPTPTTSSPVVLLATASSHAGGSNSTTKDSTESGAGAVNEDAIVGFDADLGSAAGTTTAPSAAAETAGSTASVGVATAPAPSSDQGTVEANTKSSGGSSSSAGLIVALVFGAVALTAAAVIVVIRKKKQALEELEQKSPMATPAGALAAYRASHVSQL